MTTSLTEQEQLLLAHHRDMEANGRYGELMAKYEAGRLVTVKKAETILVPRGNNNNNNGGKKK